MYIRGNKVVVLFERGTSQFVIYVTGTRACTQHVPVGSSSQTIHNTSKLSPYLVIWTSLGIYIMYLGHNNYVVPVVV